MLRRALATLFAIAVIAIGSSASAGAVTSVDRSLKSATVQSDLAALINAYRTSNGLQAVSPNSALTSAAGWMAGDMAARNYIGHVSSDGRSPTQRMSAFGYPATSMYTGEDLGAGYGTASAVLAGWQASAAHNAVLLNPNYDALGIGLVYEPSSTYTWYWAADFGGPGGTVTVIVLPAARPQPVAARAATAPRGFAPRAVEEPVDPEVAAQAARIAFIERLGARRIAHLFAVLLRMGAI
ncbi:MAG: CAP domain-containing protein [Chloroflexota bacterium]